MATFTEFYTTLLGFVNFRLYQSLNLHYPPKVSETGKPLRSPPYLLTGNVPNSLFNIEPHLTLPFFEKNYFPKMSQDFCDCNLKTTIAYSTRGLGCPPACLEGVDTPMSVVCAFQIESCCSVESKSEDGEAYALDSESTLEVRRLVPNLHIPP